MNQGTTKQTLQGLIDGLPDLVDHFWNDTQAPHFSRAGTAAAALIPPVFTNWRDEQRSWSETAVLFEQSHHMPELFLDGPDALKLLTRLGVNTFTNFATDRAKQFVACTPAGHVIGDCILYRHGEESFELVSGMPLLNWVHYNAETGGYHVTVVRDNHTPANPSGRRVKFRFQLDGPNAGKVFAKAVDGEPPTIPFFRTAKVTIAGKDVLVLRHGMAGHQGVELSGAFDDHDAVRDALLAAGKEHGLRQAGTTAYFSTPLSNAWMAYPVPGIFTGEELRGFREWLPADTWEASTNLSGSFLSSTIEDYYVTPYDLGYERIVKFDHDFIGREALENLRPEDRRTKRTLVFNREDVAKVYASQFGEGPRYKSIELPVAYYGWNHFDDVRDASGTHAGVSCHTGYLSNEGEVISLAMLNTEHAEIGTELVLTWGEPNGGSRKPQVEMHEQIEIRATVAPAPFASAVQRMLRASVGGNA
jgi:glycine cleavage system aminomethyltransferase T